MNQCIVSPRLMDLTYILHVNIRNVTMKMHTYEDILPLRTAMLKFKGPPVPKLDKYKALLETYWLTKETCKFWLER